MNISYEYYRIFYYVVKMGSFTQAASFLMASQPNLTRAVRNLEEQLGCTLLVRSHKGVSLTPDGERLYQHVAKACEHIQLGEEEISLSRSMERGMVSLGASEIALRCFILPILNQYRRLYPGIQIKISNVSSPQAAALIRDGLLDLAVISSPIDSGTDLSTKKLAPLQEVPIVGPAYQELASETNLSLARLAQQPIISLSHKTSTYEFYCKLFLQEGLAFRPQIEAATADQILPLVQHNLGVGFVPEEFLQENLPSVHRLSLQTRIPTRHICLIKKKNHTLSLPAKELERMIQDHAQ